MSRPPVLGEPGYSQSHYHREGAPTCGLGTGMGACFWPKEPGMPWCNSHLSAFLDQMRVGGYSLDQARSYFALQGWDAVAVECVSARYERVLGVKKDVAPARKPRGL